MSQEQPYRMLEREFEDWTQQPNMVACASGTAALQLALEALALPKDSTVLIPDFCMVSVARACTMAGVRPYPIDCDSQSLNFNVHLVPRMAVSLGKGYVSALIVVHTYGRLCEMEAIHQWAEMNDVFVIEDMAEAPDQKPDPRTTVACWSFYRNKIIHGEEGGMCSFQNPIAAERARQLRSCGFTQEHDFLHLPGGFNARLSNANADLIRESLKSAVWSIDRRRFIAGVYDDLTATSKDWQRPKPESNWVYALQVPNGLPYNAIDLVRKLRLEVSGARMAFKPIREQPEYYSGGYENSHAYRASRQVFYLPIDPFDTTSEIRERVVKLKEVSKNLACRA